MRTLIKLTLLLFSSTILHGQDAEIDRLISNEFKMTFPSIYFKHNSTDYAKMPYTADSCFKYIALLYDKNINSLVIWRDSVETEELTSKRSKKLKAGLHKYTRDNNIQIQSMGNDQKISRQTINMTSDQTKINYLLSLNSVFDISKTRIPNTPTTNTSHIYHPKIWCWSCWKSGFHMDKKSRDLRKVARRSKKAKTNQ